MSGRCDRQLKKGETATREEILKFMDGKIAKWWMPDDVAFVDGIPHTATGKILKTALRDQFKGYRFPNAAVALPHQAARVVEAQHQAVDLEGEEVAVEVVPEQPDSTPSRAERDSTPRSRCSSSTR